MNRCRFWVTIIFVVTTLILMSGQTRSPSDNDRSEILTRIVAVVDNLVISSIDVVARLNLILFTTGIPDDLSTRQWLEPQILESLIHETLQIKEAEKLSLTVSDDEIEEQLTSLARLNAMTLDEFRSHFDRMGIPLRTLSQQIRAGLSWRKILTTRIHSQIQITDEEIDSRLAQLEQYIDKPRYLVSMISLRLHEGSSIETIRQLAGNLVSDLRGGADFAAVARQFSDAAGAIQNGGDLGWIHQGQLDRELNDALDTMDEGTISDPIQTSDGFYILLLRDRGFGLAHNIDDKQLHVQQIIWDIPSQEESRAIVERANRFRQEAIRCQTLADQVNSVNAQVRDLGHQRLSEISPQLREMLQPLALDETTVPIRIQDQIVVFIVCEKSDIPSTLPERNEIITLIGNERIDMLQRRYLQQLRHSTFIDIRSHDNTQQVESQ